MNLQVVKVKEENMTNKKNWLVIALVFGMTVVGCNSGGGGVDSALDGTWDSNGSRLKLDGGDYEISYEYGDIIRIYSRGTYSASGGEYEAEITEINGEYLSSYSFYGCNFESRWYDFDEYLEILKEGHYPSYLSEMKSYDFDKYLELITYNDNDERHVKTTYVVDDNTLTFTYYYKTYSYNYADKNYYESEGENYSRTSTSSYTRIYQN
jgi:hypothetical protein